jgi:broad specificity phosphatase PhoE
MQIVTYKNPATEAPTNYAGAIEDALAALLDLDDPSATELMLVRHGEPADDREAWGDAGVSACGREQAYLLATRLRRAGLNMVYSSTSRAAVETGSIVSMASGVPLIRTAQLDDVAVHRGTCRSHCAGDQQGLRAEVLGRFMNQPRWDALPGVEPTRRLRHRVVQSIEAIASSHPGERVAIVTHQPVINAYISMVLGIERDMFYRPGFTSISTVRILGDLYAVSTLNDQAHLIQDPAKGLIDQERITL